jgi:MFS family permease
MTSRSPLMLVLAGGLVMGLALGVRHVQGLFLLPVSMGRGWSRETFALAMALQNLCWGLAQPLAGVVADRWGSAKIIGAGLLLYALGLWGMTQATTPGGFVLSAGVVIGLALSGTSFGAVYGALSRLVAPPRRGWALGLAGAVGGLMQFAAVPLAHEGLNAWGWQGTLLALALGMLLMLPLAGWLRDQGATLSAHEQAPQQTLRAALGEAFAHRSFWMLSLGFLACGFQLAFVATHLPAYLLDRGLRPADAMAALALIALSNVLGTYCLGLLGAPPRRKYLLAGIYLVRTAAMALFVLLPASALSLYVFAAVMGFVWLGTVPLTNGLVAQMFGLRYLSTLFGLVFFAHQLGSCLGVWLGAWVFERTGSYDILWLVAMALGVWAALLHAPLDDRAVLRSGATPAVLPS